VQILCGPSPNPLPALQWFPTLQTIAPGRGPVASLCQAPLPPVLPSRAFPPGPYIELICSLAGPLAEASVAGQPVKLSGDCNNYRKAAPLVARRLSSPSRALCEGISANTMAVHRASSERALERPLPSRQRHSADRLR